ncbi:MAG: Asp-tRNA(Asn)/Glu-tRNA(Gln) amidotransferase subunit GatB [Candidatus Campbellbacteria bacterium]|nr:Asp-tRNA(Asn)/Glu-tRNA(Gln) amidotransferase subunit GatB [Candidatus Campbellbacteria bacterium]
MTTYTPTIGLEIHVELKTQTKMFCNSKNDPDEKRPNVNVCPVCMGHPGTLPVINKEAVKHVLKVGVAVGGELADFTEFDRKNYFYPDIPKGYQISQYAHPLVRGGALHGVALTRIHLEEDTARSQHAGDHSLIDFNRAGVPLMELVTEPVIHSAKEAGDFARELQLLLRTLGVSDADMEKGHLRVEVNISVSKDKNLGTKTEIKNINSFRAAEKAIAYEIERQSALLEGGGTVEQETRGWDDVKGVTFSQRKKESSHDYRYFPEPDLPKLKISEIPEFSREALSKELPELPWVKRERYKQEYEMKDEDIESIVSSPESYEYVEEIISHCSADKELLQLVANYFLNDYIALIREKAEKDGYLSIRKIAPNFFVDAVKMAKEGDLSSRGLKDLLRVLYLQEQTLDPRKVAEREGLLQQSDESALLKIVEQVINENPTVVADYKAGKEALLQFFVGQGMKLSKGAGNPKVLAELFKKHLA